MLRLEQGNSNGKGAAGGVLDGNVRPGEFVPTVKEGEDRHHGEAWAGERKDHLPKYRKSIGAVDKGRIFKIAGNALEKPAQQEGLHGQVHGDTNHQKTRQGIQEMEVLR